MFLCHLWPSTKKPEGIETNWTQQQLSPGTATSVISRVPDAMKAVAASVGEEIRVCTHLGGLRGGGGRRKT